MKSLSKRRETGGETPIMNCMVFALFLSLGAFPLATSVASAGDHLAEAIENAKQAVDHGRKGLTDAFVTRAEAALQEADEAKKGTTQNSHVEEAIAHLEAAIDFGRQKRGDLATKHAQDALTHLEAAAK
jgi:hypothetical protein